MFKKLLLLITGIIISVLSFSQQNYLPGYIIQNNGDTVTGFIDYRNWSLNPDLIEFRKTSNSAATKYKPGDIKEFTTTYSGTSVYEGTPLTQTSDYEFGFIAGAGIKTNRLSFEARLESASGMITLTSVDASTKRVYFILGYRIK